MERAGMRTAMGCRVGTLLLVSLVARGAWAQSPSPSPSAAPAAPAVVTPPANDVAPSTIPTPLPSGQAGKTPPEGVSPPVVRPPAGSGFTMNPDAKFVCANRTVTLPAVWRSDNSLSFDFQIKNEGTADLQIRAKGG